MRTVALEVHRRFAEVAVHEGGGLRRLGRIETGQLRAFAESLGPEDHVVLESTAMTWAIAELLAKHAGRVTDERHPRVVHARDAVLGGREGLRQIEAAPIFGAGVAVVVVRSARVKSAAVAEFF